jgi:hypothetical protein
MRSTTHFPTKTTRFIVETTIPVCFSTVHRRKNDKNIASNILVYAPSELKAGIDRLVNITRARLKQQKAAIIGLKRQTAAYSKTNIHSN